VANFTVSGLLMTGFSVTFTDTSTNSPAYRFWSFGDGTYDTSGARVVIHMYDTARSFKAGLVVSNAGGSSTRLTDIDVEPYTIPGY
jgi:PKD repeat protein